MQLQSPIPHTSRKNEGKKKNNLQATEVIILLHKNILRLALLSVALLRLHKSKIKVCIQTEIVCKPSKITPTIKVY